MRLAALLPKPTSKPGSRQLQRRPRSGTLLGPEAASEPAPLKGLLRGGPSLGLLRAPQGPEGVLSRLAVGDVDDPQEQEADAIAEQVMRRAKAGSASPPDPPDDRNSLRRMCSSCAASEIDEDISPKLEVGAVDDPQEREADAIADRVMRAPSSEGLLRRACTRCESEGEALRRAPALLRRACSSCEDEEALRRACAFGPREDGLARRACARCEEEEESLRREAAGGARGGRTSRPFTARVHDLRRKGGRSLAASARAFLEPRLGVSLEQVRVHADAEAGTLARQINARAFTLGQHIFFAPDELRPQSQQGMRLLAHEVAHTLQNASSLSPLPSQTPESRETPDETPQRPPSLQHRPGGRPLSSSLREDLGADFAFDLDLVRIHDDRASARALARLGTRAAAFGADVFIDPGQVALSSEDGRALLRHELTHVQQYLAGSLERPGAGIEVADPDGATEKQARLAAAGMSPKPAAALASPPQGPTPTSPKVISREDPEPPGSTWSASPVSLLGQSHFRPSDALGEFIESKGQDGALIHVSFGPYAKGRIRVAERYSRLAAVTDDVFGVDISGRAREFYTPSTVESSLLFEHPDLAPYAARLHIGIGEDNEIHGGLFFTEDAHQGGMIPPHALSNIRMLLGDGLDGLLKVDGLRDMRAKQVTNEIVYGQLRFQIDDFEFETGPGEKEVDPNTGKAGPRVTGSGSLRISAKEVGLDAAIDVDMPGIDQRGAKLDLDALGSGDLIGSAEYDFTLGPAKGKIQATFSNGSYELLGFTQVEKVDVGGAEASGSLTVMLTSQANAQAKMAGLLEPYGLAEVEFYRSQGDPREPRLIAWGELGFALNDGSLQGSALAVADDAGNLTAAGKLIPEMTFPLVKPRKVGATEPQHFTLAEFPVWGDRRLAGVDASVTVDYQAGYGIGEGEIGGFELTGAISTNPAIGRQLAISGEGSLPAFAMFDLDLGINLDASVLTIKVAGGSLDFQATAYLTAMSVINLGAAVVDQSAGDSDSLGNRVEGLQETYSAIKFAGVLDLAAALTFRLRGEASARLGEKPKKGEPKDKQHKRWSVEWELFDKTYQVGSASTRLTYDQVLGARDGIFGMLDTQMDLVDDEAEEQLTRFTNALLAEEDTLAEANASTEEDLIIEGGQEPYAALPEKAESLSIPVESVPYAGESYLVPTDLIERERAHGELHTFYLAVEPQPTALVQSETKEVLAWLGGQITALDGKIAGLGEADDERTELALRRTRLRRLQTVFEVLVKDASRVFDFGKWIFEPDERGAEGRLVVQADMSDPEGEGFGIEDRVYTEQRFERALKDIDRFERRTGDAAAELIDELEYQEVVGVVGDYVRDQGKGEEEFSASKGEFEEFAGGGLCRQSFHTGYTIEVSKEGEVWRCSDRCVDMELLYTGVFLAVPEADARLVALRSAVVKRRTEYTGKKAKRENTGTLNDEFLYESDICDRVLAFGDFLQSKAEEHDVHVPGYFNQKMEALVRSLGKRALIADFLAQDRGRTFLRDAADMKGDAQKVLQVLWDRKIFSQGRKGASYRDAAVRIVSFENLDPNAKRNALKELRDMPASTTEADVSAVADRLDPGNLEGLSEEERAAREREQEEERRRMEAARRPDRRVQDPWRNTKRNFIDDKKEWEALPSEGRIEASRLRFSQEGADYIFKDSGRTIDDTANQIYKAVDRDAVVNVIPRVVITWRGDPKALAEGRDDEGSVYTLSNRRVVATQLAGSNVRYTKAPTVLEMMKQAEELKDKPRKKKELKNLKDELDKFDNPGDGSSITIRGVPGKRK